MNSRITVFIFFSFALSWMHMEQWNWHYLLLHWRAFSSHYHQQSTHFSLTEIKLCRIRALIYMSSLRANKFAFQVQYNFTKIGCDQKLKFIQYNEWACLQNHTKNSRAFYNILRPKGNVCKKNKRRRRKRFESRVSNKNLIFQHR